MTTHARFRRKLAMTVGLFALAVPALSACGFDYPTDRPNEIIHGGTDLSDEGVRVNAAKIVTPSEGRGVFIATLTLNPTQSAATTGSPNPALVGLAPTPDATQTVNTTGAVEVVVNDNGLVNMADPEVGGVAVRGTFAPGDIIPMELEFDQGDVVELNVPVVSQCGPYAEVIATGGALAPNEAEGDTTEDPYSCEAPPAELPGEH